jgi:electron transport complex protein RnfD
MNDTKNQVTGNTGAPAMLLTVAPSPHIKSGVTTASIMRDVIIAMIPACIWGIFLFGWQAAVLLAVAIGASVFFEWGSAKILHRRQTVGDLSAIVTGMLIAMNLPSSAPFWLPAVGAFVAIVVVKQLFGGIGKNFLNPALAARVFLFLSWSDKMSAFPAPSVINADAVAYATPLASLRESGAVGASTLDLFLGLHGGCIGEVSALLLLIGGVYLMIRKVISWHIPVSYLATVAVITLLFPSGGGFFDVNFMLTQLLSGGLVLGAVFMATDYVTSPVTARGRLIFGVGCGLLTVLFRYFSSYPEGVSFSILVMNALVWYIDRFTRPRIFGKSGKKERRA